MPFRSFAPPLRSLCRASVAALCVAFCASELPAHDVTPNAIELRPGTTGFVFVVDLGGCEADITAKSTNSAVFKVYALDMAKGDGSLLPGGGTTITVRDRADQIFAVVAEPSLQVAQNASLEICWVGADVGKSGPCQENNCSPYSPHVVSVAVALDASNFGNLPFGGIAGDPVATATGELFVEERPDLLLRGPLPLRFARRYSSRFVADGLPTGRLGAGWRHSFEWSLADLGEAVEITAADGRQLRFERSPFTTTWTRVKGSDQPYALIDGSSGGFVLRDPEQHVLRTFDSNGRMTQVADGRGNALTLSYTSGRLSGVADGLGRAFTLAYDANSRLQQLADGTRTVGYAYDGSGRLATVTDAEGGATHFAYSATLPGRALLAATTRPEGNVPWTQAYDSGGRVVSQQDAVGNLRTFAYDDGAGTTTITEPTFATQQHTHASGRLTRLQFENGKAATLSYDSSGRRTQVVDRRGDRSTVAFDSASGFPASVTAPDGSVTRWQWSARVASGFTFHDVTRITAPGGEFEQFTWDPAGNVLTRTDFGGGVWSRTYGARGEVLTATAPDGGVRLAGWRSDLLLDHVVDAAGQTTGFDYDALGRLTDVMLSGGAMRHAVWDHLDRLTSITDEIGETTLLAWDMNSNLQTVQLPGSRTFSFSYDSMDRVWAVLDPEGGSATIQFDVLGRPSSVTDGGGISLQLAWNASGRLLGATDGSGLDYSLGYDDEDVLASFDAADGARTTFTSDRRGQLTRITSAEGREQRFTRDRNGRVAETTSGEGARTRFTRDESGAVIEAATLNGGQTMTIDRDSRGRSIGVGSGGGVRFARNRDERGDVVGAIDPVGREWLTTLDVRGLPSRVDLPGAAHVDLQWSDRGELAEANFSDGTTIEWLHDDDGRIVSATDVAISRDDVGRVEISNGIASTRDLAGRLLTTTLQPGLIVSYQYDLAGRLAHVGDGGVGSVDYAWDTAGRLASRTFGNGVLERYDWDNDGWLARFRVDGSSGSMADLQFTRDDAGRIVTADRLQPVVGLPAVGVMTSVFDAAGQDAALSYDALGRRTGDGTRSYSWDGAGRLVGANDGTDSYDFTWDGLGRVLSGRVNLGPLTEFTWNDATTRPSLGFMSDGGVPSHAYVATPTGELLWSIDLSTSAREYYHFDENGNTLFETDAAGAISDAYAWGPMGELLGTLGGSTSYPYADLALGGRDFALSLGVGVAFGDRVWDTAHCSTLQPIRDFGWLAQLGATPYGLGRFPQPGGRLGRADESVSVALDTFATAIGGGLDNRWLGGDSRFDGRSLARRFDLDGVLTSAANRQNVALVMHLALGATTCILCHSGQTLDLSTLIGPLEAQGRGAAAPPATLLAGASGYFGDRLLGFDRRPFADWLDRSVARLATDEPLPPAIDGVNARLAIEKLLAVEMFVGFAEVPGAVSDAARRARADDVASDFLEAFAHLGSDE